MSKIDELAILDFEEPACLGEKRYEAEPIPSRNKVGNLATKLEEMDLYIEKTCDLFRAILNMYEIYAGNLSAQDAKTYQGLVDLAFDRCIAMQKEIKKLTAEAYALHKEESKENAA